MSCSGIGGFPRISDATQAWRRHAGDRGRHSRHFRDLQHDDPDRERLRRGDGRFRRSADRQEPGSDLVTVCAAAGIRMTNGDTTRRMRTRRAGSRCRELRSSANVARHDLLLASSRNRQISSGMRTRPRSFLPIFPAARSGSSSTPPTSSRMWHRSGSAMSSIMR